MGKRRFGGVAAAVAVLLITAVPATAVEDHRPGDQAAFDRLHDLQARAWADEDGAAFAATYTEDGDVVTFNGDHLHGREGIARGMQYYFDNFIDGSRIKRLSEQVRYLDRGTALIVRSSCLTQGDVPDCRPDSLSTTTNLLVRRHGQWLQESFQNTRYFTIP
ncbi:SgcJ/EcaC family oxidoreductase [Amycolatopsis magusensis]|uniref:SgcJ/EcaC family oxidoreductase n=1 Tax=Amycolatopsis magusensis TaxID=882444 RepID=UPI003C2F00B3